MVCMNCGFKPEDWIDITRKCKAEISITSTDDKLGYVLLYFISDTKKKVDIGSFHFENKFIPYSKDGLYFIDNKSIEGKMIKVITKNAGYFKVLLEK